MQNIFGLTLYTGSYADYLETALTTTGYSCFVNSHMLYEAHTRKRFDNVLHDSDFLLPDGVPILYSLRILRRRQASRIAGNDITLSLVKIAQKNELKMFWIGGKPEVLDLISARLDSLNILHRTYSPPYLPIENFDYESQVNMINEFDPDIVLVGLGCPKQEIWMHNISGKIKAHMFGVGGAFLLYAGIDTRAPRWMRILALEWLYRLCLEPKRLFRRYLITNTYFLFLFVKEIFRKN